MISEFVEEEIKGSNGLSDRSEKSTFPQRVTTHLLKVTLGQYENNR
jgi:hypothetical protein